MSYLVVERSSKVESVGSILNLFVSKREVDIIYLDNYGIINDKFYGKDLKRSVLISSIDSYRMAQNRDIQLREGELGENIIMDYNPYSLKPETKLQIGEVILEISQNCTLCKSLTKIDNRLPKLLKDDRGIFAKVIQGGAIKNRDKIYLLN